MKAKPTSVLLGGVGAFLFLGLSLVVPHQDAELIVLRGILYILPFILMAIVDR